jgi:hypothetical protein
MPVNSVLPQRLMLCIKCFLSCAYVCCRAYGNVISGVLNVPVGAYVTMQLVDGGRGMNFSMGGGDQGFPFCKVVGGSHLNNADCGA